MESLSGALSGMRFGSIALQAYIGMRQPYLPRIITPGNAILRSLPLSRTAGEVAELPQRPARVGGGAGRALPVPLWLEHKWTLGTSHGPLEGGYGGGVSMEKAKDLV